MAKSDNPGGNDASNIHKGAKGQYRKLLKKSHNSGHQRQAEGAYGIG
ncbi:hypothetical protein [Rhizobium sp. RCC_161_2]